MTLFRSIQKIYEKEEELATGKLRHWPAIYRSRLPDVSLEDYTLQVRIENQLAKSISKRQLASLPTFTENRRITGKSGWTYYGQWKGITFQTLFTLFSTPHLYPWVKIESLNGYNYIIERQALLNYRILMECDSEPLSVLYGGPLSVHCFDYYIEYSIPHVKGIILMQGEHQYYHPNQAIGFLPENARVEHGRYYDIHHERMTTL